MCVQYRGVLSTVGGVQYCGGYHKYRGVFSTVGDIISTVGVFSTVGDIMINVGIS